MIDRPHAVLITGGATRWGAAVAQACAAAGMDVALQDRAEDPEMAETLAALRAPGVKASFIAADLSDPAQASGLLPAAAALLGRPLTALVNGAFLMQPDDIASLTADHMLAHYRANTVAPALLAQALLAQLPDGAVGAIVSLLPPEPADTHLSYLLSRSALMGLGDALARTAAPRLRVNAVTAGTDTDPLDVARACLHLLRSAVMTGQTLHIDADRRY